MEDIICYCKSISKKEVLLAIEKGAKSLKEIQNQTRACTGNECATKNPSGKCCSEEILKLLPNSSVGKSCCCCS